MERKRSKLEKTASKKEARRSEIVTIRLDPKLRYLAELAARRQRRTLSSFIEWGVSNSLSAVAIDETGKTVADRGDFLWDVDEADRFVRLALNYESLLTHDEQVLWKAIKETKSLWIGEGDGEPVYRESSLNRRELRTHWDKFKEVAKRGGVMSKDWPLAPF